MSKLKEKLLLNVIFPITDKVMGMYITKWYRQICRMQSWSEKNVVCWQNEQLQKLVHHAYNHARYYKRVFDELGLKPSDIKNAEDLKQLPVVTREVIRKYYDEFIPDNLSTIKYRKASTGGTTGVPMKYYCDENTWGYVTAARIFAWQQLGYHYGDKFVAFGSASLFAKKPSMLRRIYDSLRNEYPLNSVNLDDKLCAKYIEFIKKENIKYIYGYAASIYILTKYVADHNIDMTHIEAVFTTSEHLTEDYRRLIEETYQCKVMDCYGAKDAGMNAYEIKRGKYHVGYNVITELVDCIEENTGTVLTTNLLNFAFPLLRYQFGDDVTFTEDKSGYNGKVISHVVGRTSDVMRLSNGHNLTSTGFSMIIKQFDVKAFEIVQLGNLDVKLSLQVDDNKFTKAQEEEIVKTILRYLGDDCNLLVEYVKEFAPLPNGKRRHYFMPQK